MVVWGRQAWATREAGHEDGRVGGAWLALGPFFLFALAFEVVPVLTCCGRAVVDAGLGLGNFRRALTPVMIASFRNSLQISLTTALLGVVLGTVVAYALVTTPSATIRHALTALADVTTNFGGAPLAFAFIVTLGSTGFVTLLLQKVGLDLYPRFRIYSESGLTVAYLYFQLPLMILLIMPALLGLRADWREAATSLGAPGQSSGYASGSRSSPRPSWGASSSSSPTPLVPMRRRGR